MSGIDDATKLQLLAIPQLYYSAGQTDKADAAARKLIEYGKSVRATPRRAPSSRPAAT